MSARQTTKCIAGFSSARPVSVRRALYIVKRRRRRDETLDARSLGGVRERGSLSPEIYGHSCVHVHPSLPRVHTKVMRVRV